MKGTWLGYGLVLGSASVAGSLAGLVLAWMGELGGGIWAVVAGVAGSWVVAGLLIGFFAGGRPARKRPTQVKTPRSRVPRAA